MTQTEKRAQLLALVVPAALLGGAYISEYVFGLFPCEMCWWQRYPHFAALAFALLSFVAPPKRLWVAVAAGAILASGLIGVFHAGVEYGFWEGLTSCSQPSVSGADALEAIFNQPIIRCDQVQWSLLGISLAGFNAIFSIAGGLAVFKLLIGKDSV